MLTASGRTPMPSIQFIAPRKSATKRVRGLGVNLARRADLFQRARVHHGDLVGHRQGFFLIVRHEQERDADAALEVAQFAADLFAQLGIERGERFVEQQDVGLEHDGAGESDSLTLAAGELRGPARSFRFRGGPVAERPGRD